MVEEGVEADRHDPSLWWCLGKEEEVASDLDKQMEAT